MAPKSYQALVRKDSSPREVANAPRPNPLHWVQIMNEKHLRQNKAIRSYLFFAGTWQYWDMFAPDPSNNDIWFDAIVETTDGRRFEYEIKRIHSMNLIEKYFKERYRKYMERAHLDENRWGWPYLARGVARSFLQDTGQVPARLTLRRHFRYVFIDKPTPPYTVYPFFDYTVTKGDLEP